jgi:hypothetical protein
MEGFLVIGNSAARTDGSVDSTMAIIAAIAPYRARLATLSIVSWYTDRQGLSRMGMPSAINGQSR